MVDLARTLPKALFSVQASSLNLEEVIAATLPRVMVNARVQNVREPLLSATRRCEGVTVRASALNESMHPGSIV